MQYTVATVAGHIDTLCVHRRIDCCTRVHDNDVAGFDEIGKIEEPRVRDFIVRHTRHHQAHLIARKSAYFGRLSRFEVLADLYVESVFESYRAASTATGPSSAAE